jgi:cell division protein FtsB
MAPLRPPTTIWRRALNYLLAFAAVVLLVDALVGERGLVASVRTRQQSDELQTRVSQLKHENARLRELADRLETDPTTIESVAREKLGLVRAGEILVVVKDIEPATK